VASLTLAFIKMEFSHTYNWNEYVIIKLKSIFRFTLLKIVMIIGFGHLIYCLTELLGITNLSSDFPITSLCFGISISLLPIVLGCTVRNQFLKNKSLNHKIDYSLTNDFITFRGYNFMTKWDIDEVKSIKQFKEAFWIKMNGNEELFIPIDKLEKSERKDLINILTKTKANKT
jgi:hypothetical protein